MKFMQTVLACAAMAFFLAACGGGDEAQEGNGEPAEPNGDAQTTVPANGDSAGEDQYAQGQYNITEDGAADDQYQETPPEELPFPLPPDSDPVVSAEGPEMAYAAVVNVTSGQEAYEFYLDALPDAGFEIVSDVNSQDQPPPPEGPQGEGAEEGEQATEDVPFSAVLEIQSDELSGTMRFDEQRFIVGVSAAQEQPAEGEEPAPEE